MAGPSFWMNPSVNRGFSFGSTSLSVFSQEQITLNDRQMKLLQYWQWP
jgi:hypothetical protein